MHNTAEEMKWVFLVRFGFCERRWGGPGDDPTKAESGLFPPGLRLPEAKESGLTLFLPLTPPNHVQVQDGVKHRPAHMSTCPIGEGLWGHGASSQARPDSQSHCLDFEV